MNTATNSTASKLAFTQVGAHLTKGKHAAIEALISKLDWIVIGSGPSKIGFTIGTVLQQAAQDLPGGRVTHYGEIPELNIVAMRREGFKGGPVNIYLIDAGSTAVVIASEQINDVSPVAA